MTYYGNPRSYWKTRSVQWETFSVWLLTIEAEARARRHLGGRPRLRRASHLRQRHTQPYRTAVGLLVADDLGNIVRQITAGP